MTRDLYRARFFLDNKIFLLELIERCSIVFERIDRFFVSVERVQAVALARLRRDGGGGARRRRRMVAIASTKDRRVGGGGVATVANNVAEELDAT